MIGIADFKVNRKQKKLIKRVLKSGRLTYGPVTEELENKFAAMHERKYALFTSSGTAALQIALQSMKNKYGWKNGDEVIMPALTFIATFNIITYCGLKPVLVDVDPETLNIDPKLIQKAITKRTVAILPVNLLGLPADMEEIMSIAIDFNLRVLEDSCETAYIYPAGRLSDVACFSTYLAHHLTTGVGGFILTDDKDLAKYMRSMMFHGRDESYLSTDDNSPAVVHKRFIFDKQGFSMRATELEAALGLGEIDNLPKSIFKRQINAAYLQWELQDYAKFPGAFKSHSYMLFPMIVRGRDALMVHLEKNGIHTRTIMPLTNQPIIKKLGYEEKDYPVTQSINDSGMLIGCHQYLKRKDLETIIKSIKEFYG